MYLSFVFGVGSQATQIEALAHWFTPKKHQPCQSGNFCCFFCNLACNPRSDGASTNVPTLRELPSIPRKPRSKSELRGFWHESPSDRNEKEDRFYRANDNPRRSSPQTVRGTPTPSQNSCVQVSRTTLPPRERIRAFPFASSASPICPS